jgi:hypothetical protein
MARMFRGRASFKSSDVIALFVISLIGSVLFWLTLAFLHDVFEYFIPSSR